jgi:DNA ligase 4
MDFQDAMITPKVEEDLDPGLADWFKVDEMTAALPVAHEADDDSATEDDSDHADVAPEAADEVDLDDWFEVKPMVEGSTSTKPVSKHVILHPVLITFHFLLQDQHDVKMGENEAAMEYDQEFIFKHLQVAVFPRPGTLLISRSDAFIWILLGMRSKMG